MGECEANDGLLRAAATLPDGEELRYEAAPWDPRQESRAEWQQRMLHQFDRWLDDVFERLRRQLPGGVS
jgi:ferric-dicitrate binding protein FerR (iron transport regulator)